ncbi:CYTH domain-containing protein [Soehngenia saccharolytica]|nr:CYTH domain-containing protein [Tissierellales bacterium]TJX67940.1 CYTH domain-containing protein [Soehngenia saccharolytica]
MQKELEVKILNVDLNEVERKVIDQGGTLISDEEQENILIDSTKNPIKSYTDAYLRIRETKDRLNSKTDLTLTLKKNIKNDDLRENLELNVKIDSKETMLTLLRELGFDKINIGYKKRKVYEFRDAQIFFDIWDEATYPYPYIEIEVGDESKLYEILDLLDIDRSKISLKSIVELQNELKK